MIKTNPKRYIVSDPDNIKKLSLSHSQFECSFQHTTPHGTQNTSIPLISNIIFALSECSQTADLEPKIYSQEKSPEQGLLSPQRSVVLDAVKTLLIETKPIHRYARSIQTYSCIKTHD
jgi:hypothetical protein